MSAEGLMGMFNWNMVLYWSVSDVLASVQLNLQNTIIKQEHYMLNKSGRHQTQLNFVELDKVQF